MNSIVKALTIRRCISLVRYSSFAFRNVIQISSNTSLRDTEYNKSLSILGIVNRNKSTSKKKTDEDSDREDDWNTDSSLTRDSKVLKINATSLRTDMVLKSSLGVSRNKIEQLFYESKVRINGKKLLKKSATVKIGDEIDVVKSVSPKNPNHLYISRIIVLDLTAKEDSIAITVRRFKSLLIENYEDDPHKFVGGSD